MRSFNRPSHLMPIVALALFGCTPDYDLEKTNDGVDEIDENGAPDIEPNPTTVSFGSLSVTEGASSSQTVTIGNVGTADLHIYSIELEDEDAPFEIGAVGSVLVVPDGETTLAVTYRPVTSADDTTFLLISSDDPDEPVAEVELIGQGIAPVIDIDPISYDFGTLYIGCENLQPLTISNIGNDELVVESLSANTASTDLVFDANEADNGALPWSIAPGASLDVWVDYAPLDEYSDVQYITVTSNDPAAPTVMATQKGVGALYGETVDVFEQPINGSTDIIFAIDWSCSMYDDVANVGANFTTFVSTLAAMDADYHVAAVVADNGCILGSDTYIDNTMSESDQQSIFSTMACLDYGGSSCPKMGGYTEMAFTLLEAALKSSNIGSGGCNEGFYREDGTLALVGVSDEREQSINPYTYYISLFQSMKADPDDMVMHAIGGDYPTGCGGNEPYTGFYEATLATGGTFLSICAADFGSSMEVLAENSAADLTSFELTDNPVEDSIEVKVDGIAVVTGWSYNYATNSVDFADGYVPEGGSTIEVDYALMGDCEG